MPWILSLALLSALSFTRHTVGNLFGGHDVSVGDLDGDGDVDIVGAGRSVDQLVWFEWLGPDNFAPHTVFTANEVIGCWAGDLDRDGDCDLIGTDWATGNIYWYENNGSQGFTKRLVGNTGATGSFGCWDAFPYDIEGDGDPDIAGTNYNGNGTGNGYVRWFENNGSGVWTTHAVDEAYAGTAHGVCVADFNGDNRGDIITAGSGTHVNGYEYPSWTMTGIDIVSMALAVYPYDIDRDGDMDFALSADTFYWYENTTPVASREREAAPDFGIRASYGHGLLEVSLVLPAGTPYGLELYQVSGARLMTLERGIASDNETVREYRLILSPGVYYLVLRAGEFTRSAKVLAN